MAKILSKEKSIFIVCTVLNPFMSNHRGLLNESNGRSRPISDAERIEIDALFVELHKNDQRYNLKTIDFILNAIVYKCQEEGFVITLEGDELAGKAFLTIGELAERLTDTSMPIWI